MTKADFFGHFFYFFLFIGMMLIQAKDYRGWAFRFTGEAGWIGIGLVMGMSSIWLWGFAFLTVDVLGYFKWQKEQQELADLEREQAEWTESARGYLDEVFPEDFSPDCTYEQHQPYCREYKKVKTNGKRKTPLRKSSKSQRPKRRRVPSVPKVRSRKISRRKKRVSKGKM